METKCGLAMFLLLILQTIIFVTNAQTSSPKACGDTTPQVARNIVPLVIPKSGVQLTSPIECEYQITNIYNTTMTFHIRNVSIGNGSDCSQNYITVGSVGETLPSKRYTACGTQLPDWEYFTDEKKMIVKFVLNSSSGDLSNTWVDAQLGDFSDDRVSNYKECGTGFLRVTTEPTNFTLNVEKIMTSAFECRYVFYANGGGSLIFNITSLNLKNDDNCTSEYLKFVEKGTSQNTTFCGSTQGSFSTKKDSFEIRLLVRERQTPLVVQGSYYQDSPVQKPTTPRPRPAENSGPFVWASKLLSGILLLYVVTVQ
ncbi:hypothetical protein FGIG_03244 [Fasciola gigantica]|uniref:CUB domain-containing protein n=1 Tax=Fasciola gigantica TaxID=46835 RepID=A0A504Z0I2_FASGI|nr:hypothetical protein FGIG_03244 [Fasciola gigantica]